MFTVIQPDDVRDLLRNQPENLRILLEQVVLLVSSLCSPVFFLVVSRLVLSNLASSSLFQTAMFIFPFLCGMAVYVYTGYCPDRTDRGNSDCRVLRTGADKYSRSDACATVSAGGIYIYIYITEETRKSQ